MHAAANLLKEEGKEDGRHSFPTSATYGHLEAKRQWKVPCHCKLGSSLCSRKCSAAVIQLLHLGRKQKVQKSGLRQARGKKKGVSKVCKVL